MDRIKVVIRCFERGTFDFALSCLIVRLQSEEKGASFLAIGYSDQTEIPNQFECSDQTEVPSEKKTGYSGQIEKPAQFECSDQTGESSEKDGVFSFHTAG